MPSFLARLVDADPVARRRSLLLAAALLLALTLSVAAGVGAWLESQRRTLDLLSLERPADLDAYVVGTYQGLVDLPALSITIVQVEGTKARYYYDGTGTIRHDLYTSPSDTRPSEYRIFSEDQMAERADLGGRPVWLVHGQQGNPLAEIAAATGLNTTCETPWEYVALEYLIGRSTQHVACGASEMWIDVEVGVPLRSIPLHADDVSPMTIEVLEIEVGPQPPELFLPPAGLTAMGDAEYDCAIDPACESPAPATPTLSARPIVRPPPAPGDYTAPPDLTAFVAKVLATYSALPALEMRVEQVGGPGQTRHTRHFYDGFGRHRAEVDRGPDQTSSVFVDTGRGSYVSDGLTDDGRTIWSVGATILEARPPNFGIGQPCLEDWEHRGFDLVNDRPTHHLACGQAEYWVDREWLFVVRSQKKPDVLAYHTTVTQLTELRFVQPPAELFELPDDAVVCAKVRSGR